MAGTVPKARDARESAQPTKWVRFVLLTVYFLVAVAPPSPTADMQRHPFDARRSGREPFPCFDAAMQMPHSDSDSGGDGDSDNHGSVKKAAGGCACDKAASGGCNCHRLSTPTSSTTASLDWSIDGLATLLPRAFSPLASQLRASPQTLHHVRRRRRWSTGTTALATASPASHLLLVEETPPRSATFFDNESEFCVLLTPADIVARERLLLPHQPPVRIFGGVMTGESEYGTWRSTPESARRWRDLHHRCVDTIQFCEARLRERQHQLARLPIPATKLKLQRRARGRGRMYSSDKDPLHKTSESGGLDASTPLRIAREPLTPVVPTRLSFGSINLSPIPLDSAQQTSLHFDGIDPKTPTPGKRDTNSQSVFSSPALSSIAEHAADVLTPSFASLQFSPSRDLDASDSENDEEETKENKANQANQANPANPYDASASTSSLSLTSFTSTSPCTPPPHRSSAYSNDDHDEEAKSISVRQQSFLAAIEEEAQARDAEKYKNQTPSKESATEESESDVTTDDAAAVAVTPPLSFASKKPLMGMLLCPPPATSMASIYKEARAQGLTEPTAQWEYVQLIRRQTTRTRERPPAARMSF